jgi:hypothetical protein
MNYIEAIDRRVSRLPLDDQREVLDFVEFLSARRGRVASPDWVGRAWGAAPDFPDRPAQPPLDGIEGR